MPKLIKTNRLILKPIALSDFDFLRKLQTNPAVMKFIGSGLPRSEAETRSAIDKYLAMETESPLLGCWILLLEETKEPVGNILLRLPATKEEIEGFELGFSFLPEYWGRGFASESGQTVIEYAVRELGAKKMIALVDPENSSSRKTLLKLGFEMNGSTEYVDPSSGEVKKTDLLDLHTSRITDRH